MRNISKLGTQLCNVGDRRASITAASSTRKAKATGTAPLVTGATWPSPSYHNQNQQRRCFGFGVFSPTTPVLEKVTKKVPTMGDSITEVRWLWCWVDVVAQIQRVIVLSILLFRVDISIRRFWLFLFFIGSRSFNSALNKSLMFSLSLSPLKGTIVEWSVQVGQMVQEEDVVALIETDKVTVDIKADTAGVVVKQYGAV